MGHLEGIKLDAAYEYLNWYISGWVGGFIAKQGYYISVPETAKKLPHRERVGLLLRGQAGDRRHHQPDRREDQQRRRHPRRRLLRGALLQGRRVEQPDGRGGVPVRQVERVQRGLTRPDARDCNRGGRRAIAAPAPSILGRSQRDEEERPARHLSAGGAALPGAPPLRHRAAGAGRWSSASSATRCWSGWCPTSPSRTTSTSSPIRRPGGSISRPSSSR